MILVPLCRLSWYKGNRNPVGFTTLNGVETEIITL